MAYTDKDKRNHIKEIQYYLRHIAHHNGNQSLIIPDGIYGSETRDAVENFQRENGLPVTGEVDNTTWDAIVDEYNRIRSYVEIPYCIHPFGSPRNVIHYGEGGYIVYLIQIMLNTVSAVTDNLPELEIDGKYGDKTFNAVKKYQLLSGLPVTGETDVNTWNMLSRTYNSVASGI